MTNFKIDVISDPICPWVSSTANKPIYHLTD